MIHFELEIFFFSPKNIWFNFLIAKNPSNRWTYTHHFLPTTRYRYGVTHCKTAPRVPHNSAAVIISLPETTRCSVDGKGQR